MASAVTAGNGHTMDTRKHIQVALKEIEADHSLSLFDAAVIKCNQLLELIRQNEQLKNKQKMLSGAMSVSGRWTGPFLDAINGWRPGGSRWNTSEKFARFFREFLKKKPGIEWRNGCV